MTAYFTPEELAEINMLLTEGLKQLDYIEKDIKDVLAESRANSPAAAAIRQAIAHIDHEAQLVAIKKSRASLRFVKAKIEIDEYSDSDSEEVCNILDDVKTWGQQLAGTARQYRLHLQRQCERN